MGILDSRIRHIVSILLFAASSCPASDAELSESELREEREHILARLDDRPTPIPSSQRHGRIGLYGSPRPAQWVAIDLGRRIAPEEVVVFPARLPVESDLEDSVGFPRELEVEIAVDASFADAVRLGRWQVSSPDEAGRVPFLRFRVPPGSRPGGRYLRLRIFGSHPRPSGRGRFWTLGEIVVRAAGRNVALRRPVTTSGEIENAPRWQAENLTDGYLWCLPGRGRVASEWNGFHSAIGSNPDRGGTAR